MHTKPLFEGQRLERYMFRINRLLGTEQKSHSPWKVGPPKRIKTQGPMVERLDTFINYQQNFILLNRIIELKVQNILAFAMEKLKSKEKKRERSRRKQVPNLKLPVRQVKYKNNILIRRTFNIILEQIREAFRRIKQSNQRMVIKRLVKIQTKQKSQIASKAIKISTFKAKVFMKSIQRLFKNKLISFLFCLIKYEHQKEIEVQHQYKSKTKPGNCPENIQIKFQKIISNFRSGLKSKISQSLLKVQNTYVSQIMKKKSSQCSRQNRKVLPTKLIVIVKQKIFNFLKHSFSKLMTNYKSILKQLMKEKSNKKIRRKLQFGNQIHSLSKLTHSLSRIINDICGQFFYALKNVQQESQKQKQQSKKYISSSNIFKSVQKATSIITSLFLIKRQTYLTVSFKNLQSNCAIDKPQNKCIVSLFTSIQSFRLRTLAVSFWEMLNFKLQTTNHYNQSCSNFIYEEVMEFLDKQDQMAIELNRYSSTIYEMIGLDSTMRSHDTSSNFKANYYNKKLL